MCISLGLRTIKNALHPRLCDQSVTSTQKRLVEPLYSLRNQNNVKEIKRARACHQGPACVMHRGMRCATYVAWRFSQPPTLRNLEAKKV